MVVCTSARTFASAMAEVQIRHRQECEHRALDLQSADARADRKERLLGQSFALIIALSGIGAAVALPVYASDTVAAIVCPVLVGFPLVCIVTAFIAGRKSSDPSTEEKKKSQRRA